MSVMEEQNQAMANLLHDRQRLLRALMYLSRQLHDKGDANLAKEADMVIETVRHPHNRTFDA